MASDQLFAPAFREQKLSRLFKSVVVIMVYIATFAMAAEALLSTTSLNWNQGMENRLTVEIPAVGDEASATQAERIRQALAVLRAIPGITRTTLLSDDDTARLLKPWIADADVLKKLPVPALIEVERRSNGALTAPALQEKLRSVVSNALVEDHAAWLADFSRMVHGLAALAALMIALTGFTLVIAISLICRTVMAMENDTMVLLHALGAEDRVIARHFELHALRLTWPAAVIGFLLALICLSGFLFSLRHIVDPAAVPAARGLSIALLMFLVPLAAVWAAMAAARISVLKLLQPIP